MVATPGHEVVYATLRAPVPWREGFALIDGHLRQQRRPGAALCAIALRSPAPLTFDGFAEFNAGYRALLESWKLLVNGDNPIARTNVAPVVAAPPDPSLYAFAYTAPGDTARPTFVVAGSGEVDELVAERIVRRGETSVEAMRAKATFVMDVMEARLRALGADWPDVTAIDVYTARPIEPFLAEIVLARAGAAAVHGVRWFPSRPPIVGLDYEMDLRGVAREVWA